MEEISVLKEPLTPKEKEIASALAQGFNNDKISDVLCLKKKTVEHYINSIINKCSIPEWMNKRVWITNNIDKLIKESTIYEDNQENTSVV